MRARPHDLALPLRSPHPQTRSHPEVPGVRTPAYLCSGDATQPTTPVWSPSVLTGSLRPAAVEGRRKRSQNTRFLTPPSGTCDGHTLWATWRRGPLGKRGTVSPRADALRTPSGPAGKRSSSPTRQPVLGPPAGQQGTPPAPSFRLRSAAAPGLVFTFRSSRDHLSHLRGAQGAHLSPGGRHSKPSGKWQIVSPPTLSLGRSALGPRNPVSSMDPVLWKAAVKSVHTAARTHARTQDAGLAPRKAAGAPDRPAHVTASAGNRPYHSDFN